MKLFPKRFSHLTRYIVCLGILVFISYLLQWEETITLILMGPSLYLAYFLKGLVPSAIPIPSWPWVNDFIFVLPMTVLYFVIVGFQIKKLYNEHGIVRIFMLFIVLAFLAYIHAQAWRNLSAYLPASPFRSAAQP